jgi:hypothetical protein
MRPPSSFQEERRAHLITGAHAIIYSANPDADRDFMREPKARNKPKPGRRKPAKR